MVWLLFLGCSIDAGLNAKDGDASVDSGTSLDSGDTDAEATETCNGIDDDGDGEVDEGFADVDEDGIADCVDPTCPAVEVAAAGTIAPLATCVDGQRVEPVTDPWSTTVEWTWNGGAPDEGGLLSGPVVAVTDDTDGDGALTEADVPAVVVVTQDMRRNIGVVVALDGATGVERWRWQGAAIYQQPAVADVNDDGVPEVLVFEKDNSVAAIEPGGTLLWRSSQPTSALYGQGVVNVADLDGDGTVEVLADNTVIEGATGVVRFQVTVRHGTTQLGGPAAADLDGDGSAELLCYGNVYDGDGTRLWGSGDTNYHGNWAVPVQADEDAAPEIVMIGMELGLYEPSGRQLSSGPYQRNAYAGAPCAGDFDRDGEVEIAFGSWSNFLMMSLDGAIEWETTIEDSSCCGGCAAFDLDGDGGLEILYNDHQAAYVFDGATGIPLVAVPRVAATIYEYPVVADIDLDGASEILVTSDFNTSYPAIVALGNAGSGWPSLGSTWPIHDYAVSNINPDASVPTPPDPFWSLYRVYRGRVPVSTPLVDAFVTFTDACQMDCVDGPAEVALQVGNQGLEGVPPGSLLVLYAVSGGEAREIDRWTLPAIPSGATLAGIDRVLLAEELGTDGYRAVLTVPDGASQCDETNDVAEWTDVPC